MEFTYKEDAIVPFKNERPNYLKDNIKGDVFHRAYLDYLYAGYASHYGIIVKPDHIWFTILCEISRAVKESPEHYRDIFTDSQEKKSVSVLTGDPIVMPVDSLLESVFKLIPDGLKKENILLNFSTTTPASTVAFSTAFLEAASPYYSYSMFACGFNKIKVLGTFEDWEMMRICIEDLYKVFEGKKIAKYFNKVSDVLLDITSNLEEEGFWKVIFYVQRCGSGSQQEVKGWFSKLFDEFDGLKFMSAYPKHVSVIEYKNLDTNKMYKMDVGILSSVVEDGYLTPDFEFGVNEIPEK